MLPLKAKTRDRPRAGAAPKKVVGGISFAADSFKQTLYLRSIRTMNLELADLQQVF
jgi:hypothetical protein